MSETTTQEELEDQIKELEHEITTMNESINNSIETCTQFSLAVKEQLCKVDGAIEIRNNMTILLQGLYSKLESDEKQQTPENQSAISPESLDDTDKKDTDGTMLVHEELKP